MKTLSRENLLDIKTWMHRNAREVDLAAWRCHFENGSEEDVLSALTYYQNADGGFGRALEADSWNPDSSPYTTLYAIKILNGIGFTDMRHPILQGIVRFLESGAHCLENGWYFNIPSNNDHPHAPWWTFDMKANAVESIGLTAELAAFVLTRCDKGAG